MAWIESHQQLKDHPKVYDLMNDMDWDLDTTIGKLHRFWWWCVDYAEDGDLRKHTKNRLAMAVGLNSENSDKFIQAMINSLWIDEKPYFRVHDWWSYLGRFLQVKYKHNPLVWKKIQKLYNNRSNNRYNKRYENHKPNLTKPNLTKPNLISEQNEVLLDSFEENLKNKVIVYLERIRLKNKSKVITEGRKNTLIKELFNTKTRFNNDTNFSYALDQAIGRDACNIGYINAILKNKITEKPL